MYFMFLKIIDVRHRSDIFMALESVDITRTTFLHGYNLEKVFNDEVPLFKGFFEEISNAEKETIVVTAFVEKKEQVKDFLKLLNEAGVNVYEEEILRVLLLPCDFIFDNKLGIIEK